MGSSFSYKKCSRCRVSKPKAEFYRVSRWKDGLSHTCKECMRSYRREHREQRRTYTRGWLLKHPNYHRGWSAKNPGKAYTYVKRWCLRNPGKARRIDLLRNVQRRGVGGDPSISLDGLYDRDEGMCGICNELVERKEASVDHVVPLSRGGRHAWDNVQLAHFLCNARKNDQLLEDHQNVM